MRGGERRTRTDTRNKNTSVPSPLSSDVHEPDPACCLPRPPSCLSRTPPSPRLPITPASPRPRVCVSVQQGGRHRGPRNGRGDVPLLQEMSVFPGHRKGCVFASALPPVPAGSGLLRGHLRDTRRLSCSPGKLLTPPPWQQHCNLPRAASWVSQGEPCSLAWARARLLCLRTAGPARRGTAGSGVTSDSAWHSGPREPAGKRNTERSQWSRWPALRVRRREGPGAAPQTVCSLTSRGRSLGDPAGAEGKC